MALAFDQLVRHLWESIRPDLSPDERVEYDTLGSGRVMLEAAADSYSVRVSFYRVDQERLPRPSTWKSWSSDIPGQLFRLNTEQIIEIVSSELRYLVALLRPRRPPKGWRLFSRRR